MRGAKPTLTLSVPILVKARMRSRPVTILRHLVEVCENGEQGFRRAAAAVRDNHLASVLFEYAAQREQFGAQLMYQIARLGGRPQKHGTLAGVAHRRWIRMRAAFGADDATIIDECERGERYAIQHYERAFAAQLPDEVRGVIEQHLIQIVAAHNHLVDLQNRVCHESAC